MYILIARTYKVHECIINDMQFVESARASRRKGRTKKCDAAKMR